MTQSLTEEYSLDSEKLDLSGQGLAELPAELGQFKQLKSLDLRNNQLSSLPRSLSQDHPDLETLDISGNEFTDIPPELDLKSLRRFAISGNSISSIREDDIEDLNNLEELDASNNNLSDVPASLGNLHRLKKLNIGSNNLTTVPSEIGQLDKLETLDLSNNEMEVLPPEVCQLRSLESLYINENKLKRVPPEIDQLNALQMLDLSNNDLDEIPAEACNLRALLYLYLNENNLTSLPHEIGRLSNLKFLSMYDNALEAIPPSLGDLGQLINLNVDGNELRSMSSETANLSSLKVIYLSNCKFQHMPEPVPSLRNLTELHMQGNEMTSVPPSIGDLKQLVKCDFNNNALETLPEEIGQLQKLRELSLGYNSFEVFPKSLTRLHGLQELSLEHNKLEAIPEEISDLSHLKVVRLNDNKLTNDAMKPLAKFKDLNVLDVSRNEVTVVPPSIKSVTIGVQEDQLSSSDSDEDEPEDVEEARVINVISDKKKYRKILPSNFFLDVPPYATRTHIRLKADIVRDTTLHPIVKGFEELVSDVIDLSPHTARFDKPLTLGFIIRSAQNDVQFAVLKNEGGEWKDVKTQEDKKCLTVKIQTLSVFAVVSRPRAHTVNVDKQGMKFREGRNLLPCFEIPPGSLTHDVKLSMRIFEKHFEPTDSSLGIQAFEFILLNKPDRDVSLEKPAVMRLPHPPGYKMALTKAGGKAVDLKPNLVVYTSNDFANTWIDVTDEVPHEYDDTEIRCTANKLRSYGVTVSYTTGLWTDQSKNSISKKYRPLRRGERLAKVILVQHVEDPKALVIDIVDRRSTANFLQFWKDNGYEPRYDAAATYSKDVVIRNGDKVSLRSGKGCKLVASKSVTFYSNKSNYLVTYAETNENPADGKKDGVVKIRLGNERIKLPFKISEKLPEESQNEGDTGSEPVMHQAYKALSQKIQSSRWKPLARSLGVEEFEIHRLTYAHSDVQDRVYHMLLLWQRKFGDDTKAAKDVLASALKEENMDALVDLVGKKSRTCTLV
ncbi:uncharacterized protein [Ptychodera flava]|uniref:uncharacterized protein n=1 Tax=Ptychodera flava TaxID=63121 RepID=UPI00396AB038